MGEVSDYVASLSGDHRAVVAHVYARALAVVPEAEEGRGYGMPALRYRGRPLISAVSTARHVGLYPFSAQVLAALADDLAGFRTTKGAVAVDPADRLPDDLLDRIVQARRDEIDGARAR